MVEENERKGQHFVVVGIGLVGVVLAIELKRRVPNCSVTIMEKRTEESSMDGSWSISVSQPGIQALSTNFALLEKVIGSAEVFKSTKKSIHLNGRVVHSTTSLSMENNNNGLPHAIGIDRGKTLKVCLFHLREEYPDVEILYECKLIGVDEENGTFFTEPPLPTTTKAKFDMLFGADGASSSVRRFCTCIAKGTQVQPSPTEMLVLRLMSSPSETLGAFELGFYISTKPPPGQETGAIKTRYSSAAKTLTNIGLLVTGISSGGQQINEVILIRDHIKLERSLYPQTQHELEENLTQLGMPKLICKKLKLTEGSRERVLYTVKATQYHNVAGNIAILGDAAHATYPSIGGGFNTGLQDVKALVDCICHSTRSSSENLSEYSQQRVPVGRALVDISNLLVHSPASPMSSAGTGALVNFVCRGTAHYLTCGIVKAPSPFMCYKRDPIAEFHNGQKTTVELAEDWKKEIKTMNKELEAWHDEIALGQQRSSHNNSDRQTLP